MSLVNSPRQLSNYHLIGVVLNNKLEAGAWAFDPNMLYQYLRLTKIKVHESITDWTLMAKLQKLDQFMAKLWKIADAHGWSFVVNAADRPPIGNKAVGGSTTSQHMYCEAIDFLIYNKDRRLYGEDLTIVYKTLDKEMGEGIKQLIAYRSFIHASMPSQDINRHVRKYRGDKR